jgi:hypothetical protein
MRQLWKSIEQASYACCVLTWVCSAKEICWVCNVEIELKGEELSLIEEIFFRGRLRTVKQPRWYSFFLEQLLDSVYFPETLGHISIALNNKKTNLKNSFNHR